MQLNDRDRGIASLAAFVLAAVGAALNLLQAGQGRNMLQALEAVSKSLNVTLRSFGAALTGELSFLMTLLLLALCLLPPMLALIGGFRALSRRGGTGPLIAGALLLWGWVGLALAAASGAANPAEAAASLLSGLFLETLGKNAADLLKPEATESLAGYVLTSRFVLWSFLYIAAAACAYFGRAGAADAATEAAAGSDQPVDSTQADLDAIMKKYDRESNIRIWEGLPRWVVHYLLAAFSLFVVWMNLYSVWSETKRRPIFLGFVVMLVFLVFPRKKGGLQRPNTIPWYDVLLALLCGLPFLYFFFNEPSLMLRATRIYQTEVILGIIGALLLFECCRRVVGLPILVVASCFIIYAFTTGKALRRIVYDLFYTTNGIIGTPIGVCSTYIVLFIIFGAFLEATGIAGFFIDCANALVGWATGGPAKVAVVSSALCGMVSGSSVGNTVTTGSVTIPMMKRTGYPGEFAGAVEAASSTGGQIMPPIMGAAAFVMAEIVSRPYSDIIVRAILPAILYFTGIFLQVHLRAKRLDLRGIPREDLPKWRVLWKKLYLLVPLVVLVGMIMHGNTMSRSAIIATILCVIVSLFNKENRMTVNGFFDALENGARNCLSIAVACGVAGIIAGVVTLTGLGQVFISAIVSLANGQLLIALACTMVACIILGMGVPTTANYIIMATTCAPILTTGMGMNVIAANMFVFYFGIVADITPPVALAAYAGSAIAKAPPMKTAFQATRLAIAAFLIPYIFALNPAMLFIDTDAVSVILIIVTSFLGMSGVAAGIEGYLLRTMNWAERVIIVAGGLMMLYPGTLSDIVGAVIVAAIGGMQLMERKRAGA